MIEFINNAAGQGAKVFITGIIDQEAAVQLEKDIDICKEAGVKDIVFQVNSPGGSVKDGMAMYDTISALSDINTVSRITGVCASAATYPALACDTVTMTANSDFMVHEPEGGFYGNIETVETDLEYFRTLRSRIIAVYCAKTGKEPGEIEDILKAAKFMNPKQALDAGFVDSIDGEVPATEPVKEDGEQPAEEQHDDPDATQNEEGVKVENEEKTTGFATLDAFMNFLKRHNLSFVKASDDDTAPDAEVVNSLQNEVENLKVSLEAANKANKALQEKNDATEEEIRNRIANAVAERVASLGVTTSDLPAPERERTLTKEEFQNKVKEVYNKHGLEAAQRFITEHSI